VAFEQRQQRSLSGVLAGGHSEQEQHGRKQVSERVDHTAREAQRKDTSKHKGAGANQHTSIDSRWATHRGCRT